jgi:hypothetical protein
MKKVILLNFFKMKIMLTKFKMEVMKKKATYENEYYIQNLITVDSTEFDKYIEKHFEYFVQNAYGLGHALMLFKKDIVAIVKFKLMDILTK